MKDFVEAIHNSVCCATPSHKLYMRRQYRQYGGSPSHPWGLTYSPPFLFMIRLLLYSPTWIYSLTSQTLPTVHSQAFYGRRGIYTFVSAYE